MQSLTLSQITSGFRDNKSLIQFINRVLGYNISPIAYNNPQDELQIPQHLSEKIKSWWLISSYQGNISFQIYLSELKELNLYLCREISTGFVRRHPANYLFIFTDNYLNIVFFTLERSLEKRPITWKREIKYYCRFLVIDRLNPTYNDLKVLKNIRINYSITDSIDIYHKIISALKSSSKEAPHWFMPYYYKLGLSSEMYQKIISME